MRQASSAACSSSRRPYATQQRTARPCRPRRALTACQAAAGGQIQREVLSRQERSKLNTGDDRQFYDTPRLVKHVDDGFLEQVTELYRQRIPQDAAVLDLMSSWVSHLPKDKRYGRVVGHGMNAEELAKNRQLDSFFVRNLNTDPSSWALEDQSMDAVLCCVSVQYLQQPEPVFAEIYRVLKPGGVCIVTFSNRLFYDKAIAAWRDNSGYGRSQLVASYFQAVSGFTKPEILTEVGLSEAQKRPRSLLKMLQMLVQRSSSDPLYAVVAYRNFKRVDE